MDQLMFFQVTRFQWLHEDLLDMTSNSSLSHRRNIINDLTKRMATLQHLDGALHQLQVGISCFSPYD